MNELIAAYQEETPDFYKMMDALEKKQKHITMINDDLDMCHYYIEQSKKEIEPDEAQIAYNERMDCLRNMTAEERQSDLDTISFAEICQAGWNKQDGKASLLDLEIVEKCTMVENDNRNKTDIISDLYCQNWCLTKDVDRLMTEVEQVSTKLDEQVQLNTMLFEKVQLIFNRQLKTRQETCAYIQSEEYKNNEIEWGNCLSEYWRIKQLFDSPSDISVLHIDNNEEDPIIKIDEVDL